MPSPATCLVCGSKCPGKVRKCAPGKAVCCSCQNPALEPAPWMKTSVVGLVCMLGAAGLRARHKPSAEPGQRHAAQHQRHTRPELPAQRLLQEEEGEERRQH